jgi:glutathione S-transferase
MIQVHHLNHSRSQRVLWCLEELDLEYLIVAYQRDAKTMLAPPELKAIHPLGKSPVITDGSKVIAESGAILEYLAEREGKLSPARSTNEFERYRYWVHYAEGSLMPQVLLRLYLGRVGEAAGPLLERVESQIQMHLDFIDESLSDSFVAGGQLTVADIQLSFPVEVAASQKLLQGHHSRTRDWLKRLHDRPAYQQALTKGGPYAYAKD